MKIVLYYFSGTGNTKWAVNELSHELIQKGHACNVISIEEKGIDLKESIANADVFGFAFPIYGANMPNKMKHMFQEIQKVHVDNKQKPAFILTTAGFVDAFGPISANRYLKRCGFKLLSYINIRLSNNLSTPKVKSKIESSEIIKTRREQSQKELQKLANCIIQQKRYVRNIGPYLLPGVVIRKLTKKALGNCNLLLSVDYARCKKCMRCVNNCPTNSIAYEHQQFQFSPTCTACMRCYNFCPTNAILHDGQYADPQVYKRYHGPL